MLGDTAYDGDELPEKMDECGPKPAIPTAATDTTVQLHQVPYELRSSSVFLSRAARSAEQHLHLLANTPICTPSNELQFASRSSTLTEVFGLSPRGLKVLRAVCARLVRLRPESQTFSGPSLFVNQRHEPGGLATRA
jgi:hypothetical protein